MPDSRKSLIDRLFAQNEQRLRGFFRRRIRAKGEAQDLAQEVYLRMLRVGEAEVLRNPEAYLYTVARNLAKEHAVLERQQRAKVDLDCVSIAAELADLPVFEDAADNEQRLSRLREVMGQLSLKCQAAVVMQYRDGLSYAEIGRQLGISQNMVKKYLVQALAHCRKRMARLG
jgi:RNA polymerase sigma factor (sigma-70 family)